MSTNITVYLQDVSGTTLSLENDADATCAFHFTKVTDARAFVSSSLDAPGYYFSEARGVMVPTVIASVSAFDHGVDISDYLSSPV